MPWLVRAVLFVTLFDIYYWLGVNLYCWAINTGPLHLSQVPLVEDSILELCPVTW